MNRYPKAANGSTTIFRGHLHILYFVCLWPSFSHLQQNIKNSSIQFRCHSKLEFLKLFFWRLIFVTCFVNLWTFRALTETEILLIYLYLIIYIILLFLVPRKPIISKLASFLGLDSFNSQTFFINIRLVKN